MNNIIRITTIAILQAVLSVFNATAGQITMTTAKDGLVNFRIGGSGNVTVNWGDGTPDVTKKLTDGSAEFSYVCYETKARTITISGKNITALCCDNNNQLTKLDVSKNAALEVLLCSNNQLTELDVSKNAALTTLFCSNNRLTYLSTGKNPALTELYCYSNQLINLDISKNIALYRLVCYNNKLTNLDVSKNIALTVLDCSSNQLTD
jgi:hypothetical protein